MDNKNIVIITGTGEELGTGHYQRMLGLIRFFLTDPDLSVHLLIKRGTPQVSEKFKEIIIDYIPENTDIIIRDMRDSDKHEISELRKIAPVLVLDDTGDGRSVADYVLDILPNKISHPGENKILSDFFLYGYNFYESIRQIKQEQIPKDIDISIYAGSDPDMDVVNKIKKILPDQTRVILAAARGDVILSGDMDYKGLSYAEKILRSKILITHFGITLFEGSLAGCSLIVLNPTAYHSELTMLIKDRMELILLGEYADFSPFQAGIEIKEILKHSDHEKVAVDRIINKVDLGCIQFVNYIKNLLLRQEI